MLLFFQAVYAGNPLKDFVSLFVHNFLSSANNC